MAPKTTEELLRDEEEIQKELDRRAADQDAAIEAALLAGTLPDADRRADLDTVATTYFALLDATLPVGSTVERIPGGFRVMRGANGPIGDGPTIARALLMVNSHWAHTDDGVRVLMTEAGEPIPPI